ncbi:MAG TPA: DJ-1/PfpI family protein [Burkholderiaceae bacterium]|nr:DJ-1/PfpI family protein [Burkholderiaceae bacterium]
MQVAVLTFEGYNELDSFVVAAIVNRMRPRGWKAYITGPADEVTSMNGVTVRTERGLDFVREADAVLIGSGMRTREVVATPELMSRLVLDPRRQLVGAQCSGTLVLSKLGLLGSIPACTDVTTKPWVVESGVEVLEQPFFARGNVATAGGCLSSQYLAFWVIARGAGIAAAEAALDYVAPVGEKREYVARARSAVEPYLEALPVAIG